MMLLHHPALVQRLGLAENLRSFYAQTRNVIQADPACMEYDPELTYVLRRSGCSFSNIEFKTDVKGNSKGFRDDEVSLSGPRIILLGDSVSMGWGVREDQSYASLMEKELGWPILNTGISSYGTVRELRVLNRVDMSQIKLIVIQYNNNDLEENINFFRRSFQIMEKDDFWEQMRVYRNSLKYWPGKALQWTFDEIFRSYQRALRRSSREKVAPFRPSSSSFLEARAFLFTLKHASPASIGQCPIIVFDPSVYRTDFLKQLQYIQQRFPFDPLLRRLVLVDALPLNKDNFFILDDHPNVRGHRVIADALVQTIRKNI